ncbi:MAG TPA: YggS family pyridoxal phosphate-dependent enzyme [Dissulfurispiraceae bacterium]|nr:YggS family pyridoxal phosphate-dependent enzyme [Dissulfurispiraceae bacterium]
MADTILERASGIYRQMSHAAMRAGRDPAEVRLVAVTKTIQASRVLEAHHAGLRVFGENRVQEAQDKVTSAELGPLRSTIEWHLIGHLQKNKAKHAVSLFDMIHTVDSLELATVLDHHAERLGKVQKVLVQVKLSEEETKHGVPVDGLIPLLEGISSLRNLHPLGLMTMPPYLEAEETRPYFRKLRELRDDAETRGFPLPELSMGMSHDFTVAVEEGATLVRIGTAIFGERA